MLLLMVRICLLFFLTCLLKGLLTATPSNAGVESHRLWGLAIYLFVFGEGKRVKGSFKKSGCRFLDKHGSCYSYSHPACTQDGG